MPPAARAAAAARGPRVLLERSDVVRGARRVVARPAARPGRGRPRRTGWHPRSARRAARRGAPGPPRGWRPRCCAGRPTRSTGGRPKASSASARARPATGIAIGDDDRDATLGQQPDDRGQRRVDGAIRDPADDALGVGARRAVGWRASSGMPAAYGAGRRAVKHVERRPVGRPPFEARGMDLLRLGALSGPIGQRLSSTRESPSRPRSPSCGSRRHPWPADRRAGRSGACRCSPCATGRWSSRPLAERCDRPGWRPHQRCHRSGRLPAR